VLDVAGAVAVITGGYGGIGLALARRWTQLGGKVVLAARTRQKLLSAREELRKSGAEVSIAVCDVTKESDNHALAKYAVEQYGAINLVVPAAGVIQDGLLVSTDRDTGKVKSKMPFCQYETVVQTNLNGVFLTVRECLEQMINHDCRGLICLISSMAALGIAGQMNYGPSKAGVAVMPKILTAELFRRKLADRLRCVAIAPGLVDTAMLSGMKKEIMEKLLAQVPIGRLVDPAEVASLVIELYRNEALAGDTYYIHGGLRFGSMG
jgi:3-oxoacyl-[acyl-carrier protein] reductase